jgi:hypothetical protein
MVEGVSTMTMRTTKGGAEEDDSVHCLAAAAVAASPCPPSRCVPHPLPLSSWWHGLWHGQWRWQWKTTIVVKMEGSMHQKLMPTAMEWMRMVRIQK